MAGWTTNINKKKQGIDTFPVGEDLTGFESLTGAQQGVSQQFTDALKNAFAGMQDKFTYKPTMADTMKGYNPYGGEVGQATKDALLRALSGEFPEEYFRESIGGPTRDTFRRETAPAVREEFVGPGTFWGTARAGAVSGERGKMEDNLAAIRGELGYKAQVMALNAVGTSLEAQQNAQRMAQQEYLTNLQISFQDYMKSHPEMSESLQSALEYLNIPMLATYQEYDEGGNNALSEALTNAGGGA